MKMVIAIASGGDSAEEEISKLSAKTVHEHLDRRYYEGIIVLMQKGKWEAKLGDSYFPIDKNDFSFEFEGQKVRFDYVFIAIHGTPGEDGKLQAYFDLLRIPYSSPNHIGATLTFNKWYCNTLLKQLGYAVAQSHYLRRGEQIDEDAIIEKVGLPCFVKPCSGGSSYGITKVKNKSQLGLAIEKAFEYDREIMIEEHLSGKELTCGVFEKEGSAVALPITQIIPKGEFFDYEAKYLGNSIEVTPARIEEESYAQVQGISKEVYRKLDLRGGIRVDFMLVGNKAYVIEVNAVPGLSPSSLIPQQVQAAKMSMKDYFSCIIEATGKAQWR